MITFNKIHQEKNSYARVGVLTTPHGIVETPAFVPVGTQATVKSLTPEDLQQIGAQVLFGNTYHLHLRPGEETIKNFEGLGKFMHWDGVTMTDSGGFQVFSLAREKKFGLEREATTGTDEIGSLVKITEDGVVFKSHLDGSQHLFTPEVSIAIQKKIGADIILSFDQCSTYPIGRDLAKDDMERTHRWGMRSLEAHKKPGKWDQGLYGIVQGSVFKDLREESAKYISQLNFDGIAIGGVSVGESKKEMLEQTQWVIPYLPDDKVRHLLGIGDVDDIFGIIERGVDTFDCVTPSRLGRVGHVFIHPPEGTMGNRFRYDITKSIYTHNSDPLDIGCGCYTCQNYTRGYIHHLFRAHELLAYRLATYHNIYFITQLTKQIRASMLEGKFRRMRRQWLG